MYGYLLSSAFTVGYVMTRLRMRLLNMLKPLTEWVGHRHMPFSRKMVTGYHYYNALPHLKKGAVLLSQKHGELSNFLIPGDFTHAAVYCGIEKITALGEEFEVPYVTEMIGRGAVKTDLITFMMTKDRVAVHFPTFADDGQMAAAADWCVKQADEETPYDYLFDPKNKAFSCAELPQQGYETVIGKEITFTKREVLGVLTIAPQDYHDAKEKWRAVWDSASVPFVSAVRF
jgi:uncharacterized protein YycO